MEEQRLTLAMTGFLLSESQQLFRIITKRIPSSDDLRPPLGTASTRLDWPNFTASSTLECQASESVFSVVSQETMICFQWSGLVRGLGMERRMFLVRNGTRNSQSFLRFTLSPTETDDDHHMAREGF
ncbi:hypothetical protein PCH_Pc18g06570 [Penicillium rubens Wisconsin 54-1255]|uniref:Uncharacterized protein n=1 Tax=Penicillium rubens (strain ATCC 28089 / DSM 1075 / NRRL 1951 / Wisconsin 54-1255) TaxID=500485 RepID=B6HCT0_PENRW|nr:hypothetical protein PCH_Pc18g06570 [Penicillium rubens Wisconsin 54-1255]